MEQKRSDNPVQRPTGQPSQRPSHGGDVEKRSYKNDTPPARTTGSGTAKPPKK